MKKFITFIAVAIMAVANMNAKNNNNNVEFNNDLPVIANVQGLGNAIQRYNDEGDRYDFRLDDEGRVVSKISYVLNDYNRWVPVAAYTVSYGKDEVILNYGEFNYKTNDFRKNVKQMRYDANEVSEIIRVPQN